ncbi:YbjQ family protein [Candidatus Nomurabacteria bacterium]|nr:YbjQ family protein [Candidatus Nomurabacteria bacterium]MCB9819229.1 YbjQ family protein [Candidatus Nomurabacteria bacterium]
MTLTTTDTVPGRENGEILGLVRGNTIRARHLGSDIGAGLKSLVGGEIKGYVKAMTDAREEALSRMIKEAEELEADAVVGVRLTTSTIMAGAAEILAYGTAIKFKQ